jgi:DNA-binding protein HU-beta
VNKEELVQSVSKKTGASQKQVAEVLAATLESIESSVAGGSKVTLVGFGTFEPRERAERTGRNPQTGAEIKIPAKKVPAFTAGKKFKDLVAGSKMAAKKK